MSVVAVLDARMDAGGDDGSDVGFGVQCGQCGAGP
jgi:hypothetical protein